METGSVLVVMMLCFPRPIHPHDSPNDLQIQSAVDEMVALSKEDVPGMNDRFETLTLNVKFMVDQELIKPMSWDELPWKYGLALMFYCIPGNWRFRTRIVTFPSIKHWEYSLDSINTHKSQVDHDSDDFIARVHRQRDKDLKTMPENHDSWPKVTVPNDPNHFEGCLDVFNDESRTEFNIHVLGSEIVPNADSFTDNSHSSSPTTSSNVDQFTNHRTEVSTASSHDYSPNHHRGSTTSYDSDHSTSHHVPPITIPYPDQSTDYQVKPPFTPHTPPTHTNYHRTSPTLPYTSYNIAPSSDRQTASVTSYATAAFRGPEQPTHADYQDSYLPSPPSRTVDASQLETRENGLHRLGFADMAYNRRTRGRIF